MNPFRSFVVFISKTLDYKYTKRGEKLQRTRAANDRRHSPAPILRDGQGSTSAG